MPKKLLTAAAVLVALRMAQAQSLVNTASLRGVVLDTSKASVPSATVFFADQRTALRRTATSDSRGAFLLQGIPLGDYRLTVSAPGFQNSTEEVSITSSGSAERTVVLSVAGTSMSMDVSGLTGSLETSAAAHTLNRSLLDRLPVQNQATGLSESITRTTPGVAADANGFAHPLGEHADTSFTVDNQPITDQQSKTFSNQISASIVSTMEIITGAPGAEFGDKTSLIVNITTLSGLGVTKPFGTIGTQVGSFGSWSQVISYGIGSKRAGKNWGNFAALSASGSNRFLDTPEFQPLHARGNSESLFDRVDWQPNEADSLHLNLSAARSWFQTPNTFDSQAVSQDQRSQIRSFNIAPGWTRVLGPHTLLTLNPFFRFDRSQYFPSSNPRADLPATLSQSRYLTNIGLRSDLAWSRGIHNAKLGSSYWHTLLREDFNIALTDPSYNVVCLHGSGEPVADPVLLTEHQCAPAGHRPNPEFIPNLLPYDLSRGGRQYAFRGSADIREFAVYAQDSIILGRLSLHPGLRYDNYNGLTRGHQLQPRFGLTYRTPRTGTVLRASYARLFETPYNENLIVASEASAGAASANPFGTFRSSPPLPGTRNQFNTGLAQSLGRHVSIDADYFWKFTQNAFDFDSLFLTPITFPIGWRKSKIDGLAARMTLTDTHGFSAYTVIGHTRSRFFGPEIGGLVFNSVPNNGVFRIDHSEEFEQTAFLRYQHGKSGPWASFTVRYSSGLALPGVLPDYDSALELTADQQAQIGLYCGNVFADRSSPIRSCTSPVFGATRVSIPLAGQENDDLHPTRVASRTILDAAVGTDDLLHTEGYKIQVRLTTLNLTNKQALYNFLSTFSGTHFLTPRALQAEFRLVF